MYQEIRVKLKNLSVKKKLFTITSLTIILLTLGFLLALSIIVHYYDRSLYQSAATYLSYSANNISNELNTIEALSSAVVVDETIQQTLAQVKDTGDLSQLKNANRVLYSSLASYYQQFKYNHLSYMAIYNHSFYTKTYTKQSLQLPNGVLDELLNSAKDQNSKAVWITKYSGTSGLFIIREIRRVGKLDTLGVLIICVDIGSLTADAADFASYYGDVSYILSQNDEIINWNQNFSNKDIQKIRSRLDEPYAILNLSQGQYFTVSSIIPGFNWEYLCLLPHSAVYQAIAAARYIFFIILVVSVLLSILLSLRFISSQTKHLDNLMKKIKSFGESVEQLPDAGYDYTDRNDEFGIVHKNFDKMAEQISTLINVNYRNELLVKDAHLKSLEMQINPHFLYNTLESINWRAKFIGERQISQMVEALGSLLRVTLNQNTRNVTIREELAFVQYYMTIQEIRFERQLQFSLDIQEDLLEQLIPKLTIQPLVENSIHYALEETTEICIISISVRRNCNIIWIDVKNSGSEFEDGLLEKLDSGETRPNGFGIGLLNIDRRLKLTFGETYGLSCFNEDAYAIARISLPWKGEC